MAATHSMRREALLRPGQRLPVMTLPAVPDGHPVELRDPMRGAPVVVVLRDASSTAGAELLDRLTQAAESLELWAGRPLAIVPGPLEEATQLVGRVEGVPFPVLADVDGAALRRLGVQRGKAALLIADRWGVVYDAVEADSEAELPPESETVEWAKYLSTQCPECGVPDEPGPGEWAS